MPLIFTLKYTFIFTIIFTFICNGFVRGTSRTVSALILLLTFLLTSSAVAQTNLQPTVFFEDFEDAPETASYITDTLAIGGYDWFFEDALIGTRDEDRKAGDRSVRIRNGSLTMLFDVPEAGYVEYLAANTGFAADGGGQVQVYFHSRSWG
ncbi:MAG: hypothetical protein LC662_05605 [Rhodothermaceae bacterium]|nr:hypothetical protein [Rhodothermaceae bacterium]